MARAATPSARAATPSAKAGRASAKGQKAKQAAGRRPASSAKAGSAKRATGIMAPVQPDPMLAEIVGEDALPRSEVTRRLWDYIKEHELQDPKNRRMIRADERLLPIFQKKKKVSMFEMARYVNEHIEA